MIKFHIMKSVPRAHRVIRVTPDVHSAAKVAAASEGKTLEQFAAAALTEALEARRHRPADDLLRVTLSKPVPSQNRA